MTKGEELRRWLASHRLSQRWLAEALGANETTVYGWLRGTCPHPSHRQKLKILTGVDFTNSTTADKSQNGVGALESRVAALEAKVEELILSLGGAP